MQANYLGNLREFQKNLVERDNDNWRRCNAALPEPWKPTPLLLAVAAVTAVAAVAAVAAATEVPSVTNAVVTLSHTHSHTHNHTQSYTPNTHTDIHTRNVSDEQLDRSNSSQQFSPLFGFSPSSSSSSSSFSSFVNRIVSHVWTSNPNNRQRYQATTRNSIQTIQANLDMIHITPHCIFEVALHSNLLVTIRKETRKNPKRILQNQFKQPRVRADTIVIVNDLLGINHRYFLQDKNGEGGNRWYGVQSSLSFERISSIHIGRTNAHVYAHAQMMMKGRRRVGSI